MPQLKEVSMCKWYYDVLRCITMYYNVLLWTSGTTMYCKWYYNVLQCTTMYYVATVYGLHQPSTPSWINPPCLGSSGAFLLYPSGGLYILSIYNDVLHIHIYIIYIYPSIPSQVISFLKRNWFLGKSLKVWVVGGAKFFCGIFGLLFSDFLGKIHF